MLWYFMVPVYAAQVNTTDWNHGQYYSWISCFSHRSIFVWILFSLRPVYPAEHASPDKDNIMDLPNCLKYSILVFKFSDSSNLPWKSLLKNNFEPFLTKFAGTFMTIRAVGAFTVAMVIATKVSRVKAPKGRIPMPPIPIVDKLGRFPVSAK